MTVLFSSRFCTHQVRWRARASSPHLLWENTYKLAQEEQGVKPPPPCNSLPHLHPLIASPTRTVLSRVTGYQPPVFRGGGVLQGSSFGSGAGQAQRFWSLRGGDLYIFVPTYCERQICTYFYWCPVRERFVHMFTGVLWERDLYIFMPASGEREICAVHACTMHLTVRERELCIYFSGVLCEREICTHLCQLPVRERFVLYIWVPAYWERQICTYFSGVLWERELYMFIPASD